MKLVLFIMMMIGVFLPVLIVYIFDRLFHLKIKLVRLFKTTKTYKTTILITSLILYLLYILILFLADKSHLYITGFAIIFVYHYLNFIPERH